MARQERPKKAAFLSVEQFDCFRDCHALTSDLLYLPGVFRCGLSGHVPPLPFGGERGGILEPCGENSEQSAYAVPSLDIVFVLHEHTKLHAA